MPSRHNQRTQSLNPLDSPNWTSESSLMRAQTTSPTGNGSPSGGKRGVDLTVSPGILCCGVGKTITATATATGDDDQNTEVTLNWPGGSEKRKGSVSHTYTVKESDCGTVLPFSASGGTESKSENVPIVRILTETEAKVPAPRTRKVLGVNERCDLALTPVVGTVRWKTNIGGVNPAVGHNTTYEAPDEGDGAVAKVEAEMVYFDNGPKKEKKITCTVDFTIREPKSVSLAIWPNTPVRHLVNTQGGGFWGQIYIHPDDVCFYRTTFVEGGCDAVLVGYWEVFNGKPEAKHLPGIPGQAVEGTQAHPSVIPAPDSILTMAGVTPFGEGTFTWDIPWYFYKRNGTPRAPKFTTVIHKVVSNATGGSVVSKGGAETPLINVSDPTSDPQKPPNYTPPQ